MTPARVCLFVRLRKGTAEIVFPGENVITKVWGTISAELASLVCASYFNITLG